jgi:hypothetical protein
MTLRERISQDMKVSMKVRDRTRLETLRTLQAALLEREIEKRGSGQVMSTVDELAVLMTAAKKRKESIDMFEKGGRKDLVEQEGKELAIINEYLPQMLTDDEIDGVVTAIIAQLGAVSSADFGKVMPVVMKQLKGKADGKLVQSIVRKRLGA